MEKIQDSISLIKQAIATHRDAENMVKSCFTEMLTEKLSHEEKKRNIYKFYRALEKKVTATHLLQMAIISLETVDHGYMPGFPLNINERTLLSGEN